MQASGRHDRALLRPSGLIGRLYPLQLTADQIVAWRYDG